MLCCSTDVAGLASGSVDLVVVLIRVDRRDGSAGVALFLLVEAILSALRSVSKRCKTGRDLRVSKTYFLNEKLTLVTGRLKGEEEEII